MQLLIDQGWKIFYQCNCGGTPREHWNNEKYPSYEITIRPRRNLFRLIYQNQLIAGPLWLYQLEDTLKQFKLYE